MEERYGRTEQPTRHRPVGSRDQGAPKQEPYLFLEKSNVLFKSRHVLILLFILTLKYLLKPSQD